ncbi:N-acetylglucosamine kinase [Propionicicella superfundia]|uniref:N-acetylglucosamine kinase n=1 Tax=Propionicicella superfundia TaxID=348582 RepID=UPI00048AFEB3|nr:BadF/BadG/BcrA/BcrD ATPase family protein [Propionicicella superfundia]
MSTADDRFLAIDGGQTAVKVSHAGRRLSFPGLRTNTEIMPQLAEVVSAVIPAPGPSDWTVAVGTTGLTRAEGDPRILLELCRARGVGRVILAHDSVTSFLGAVGFRRGVVVASGTGVVTFGVGADSVARVDGWGNLMGDVGSGFWIGRSGLEAVMRAYDGRGPATAITELATERWPDLSQAYIELQGNPGHVRLVASFAKGIACLAETDEVAAAICRRAGEELALSARTAVSRIGEAASPRPVVCLVGGVFRSRHVRESCIAGLRREWPRFEPFEAAGDGLVGAEALASLPADSPLSSSVAVAAV